LQYLYLITLILNSSGTDQSGSQSTKENTKPKNIKRKRGGKKSDQEGSASEEETGMILKS
jgi:hypothetical protein